MRWILSVMLIVTLSVTIAWAAASTSGSTAPAASAAASLTPPAKAAGTSAYDDVPTGHWAYNALDYLTQKGVLEGYPDGFFKGDRTLTRYEFAQAIARLLDTIDKQGADEQVKIMAETLRAEFSDQLADVNNKLKDIQAKQGDIETRVTDLEGNVADTNSKVSALEDKVGKMSPGPDWHGTFRYRWQFNQLNTPPAGQNTGNSQRFRQRVAFMLGYNKQINNKTMVGFRFRTNTGNDLRVPDFTAGQNAGGAANIFLDRAYVKYSPSWFGYYSDANCNECTSRLDLYAGLFPQINYDPNQMIIDQDINLQGIGAVYHFNRDFQILTAISVEVEQNTGKINDDAILSITEARYTNLFTCGLDVWAGCYCWLNESSLPDSYFTNNGLIGFDFNNDGAVNGGDRFSTSFRTAKVGAQYTFNCVWNRPLAVYAEYMVNVDSDAQSRINTVNPFITPDIIYDTSDDTGWVVGTQWGAKPSDKGDWYWYARYKEIGANAIVDGFGDNDTGGANTNSFEASAQWMWEDNALFGITYFLNRMHNAFGFLIPPSKADAQIVQVDWTFRF